MQSLGSDNHAGIQPDLLAALVAANVGHAPAYGTCTWSAEAVAALRAEFGPVEVSFVFNGTGANVLALRALVPAWRSVLCACTAHMHVDACAAPEFVAGIKLQPLPAPAGKIVPADVARHVIRAGDQHHAAPGAISITQPTELGTLYTLAELAALRAVARAHGLRVHVDGARLTAAAAALACTPGDIAAAAGCDVLSFGGTKAGMAFGEAVIFFDRALAADAAFMRKQCLQLGSKVRFVAAQFTALLAGERWRALALHAQAMAQRLAAGLRAVPGVTITQAVQTNAVFATLPRAWIKPLRATSFFYVWDAARSEVRLMTSFDTCPRAIDAFVAAAAALVAGNAPRGAGAS